MDLPLFWLIYSCLGAYLIGKYQKSVKDMTDDLFNSLIYGRYPDLIGQYQRSVKDMTDDLFNSLTGKYQRSVKDMTDDLFNSIQFNSID